MDHDQEIALLAAQAAAQELPLSQFVGHDRASGRQRICTYCGCYVDESLLRKHSERCTA